MTESKINKMFVDFCIFEVAGRKTSKA
jgi:hypothetical protein